MKTKLNVDKAIITAVTLNIVQIGAIIGIILYNYFYKTLSLDKNYLSKSLFLFILGLSVFANIFLTIRDIQSIKHFNSQYDMLRNSLEQVETLNKTLRMQRHDFMNHLQVVYSLIEMDEYNDSKDYIEKVFNDIQKVNKFLKTANPAINALLQAKILYGEKRGINTNLKITSSLKDLKVPAWEFCRVLGNIIDNSIYALSENKGNKNIEIEIFEDLKIYGFRIKNNGPIIEKHIIDKIFEAGITTKGDKGNGMGLAITKEIMEEYGGDIKVESNDSVTIFEGYIPR